MKLLFALLLFLVLSAAGWLMPASANAQYELGSEDDLTVLGVSATAEDPDVEIKGFTVFGSTQTSYTGAVAGPGHVVVNGVLSVSSGAYFVGNSTFTGAGKIFINDGSAGQLLRRNAAGYLEWNDASAMGDNLGNHVATTTLQMGAYGVNTSSNITAAAYQIKGSTVLAILPGVETIAVGPNTGRVNTGNYSVFVGSGAGAANTNGAQNSFAGHSAGYSNTTGAQNTFAGYAAGFSNATGWYNTFLGVNAGYYNTAGQYNSFVGNGAGLRNTTGSNNSILGYYSGYYNRTGSGNLISGYYAGGYGAGSDNSFSSSTVMGYQAGYSLTTGSENTFLGWQAGYNTTSGTGNIIIGYDQRASAATASNELNIGGVLYGNLSAKTIGISTRAPQAALDIVSTGTTHAEMAQIWRDGGGVIKGSMSATGVMQAVKFIGDGAGITNLIGAGDNLGNHVATTTLNMASWNMVGISSVNFRSNVFITSATAAQYGGVYVSTHVFLPAGAKYYGDGSDLTGISGVSPVNSALTSANIWVGNSSNLAAAVAMTGDVTIGNTGVTAIGSDKVTAAKILQGTAGQVLLSNATPDTAWTALSGDIASITGAGAVALKTVGTAGTYRSVTTDAQGRVSAGTNPTTFAGYGLSDTSANLAAAITNETGTGALVFGTGPAFAGMTNSGAYTQSGTSANTFTGQSTFSNATYSALFTGGNVGIGTTGPGEKLEVNGNIKLSGASATYKITNVALPTANTDVATKEYVDAAQGPRGPAVAISARTGSAYTHVNAARYCYDLSATAAMAMDGNTTTTYTDWRLPTVGEIAVFAPINDSSSYMWTTTVYEATGANWIAYRLTDSAWWGKPQSDTTTYVRCVR